MKNNACNKLLKVSLKNIFLKYSVPKILGLRIVQFILIIENLQNILFSKDKIVRVSADDFLFLWDYYH